MNWYLKVLKQYADYEGRARRKEYWMFMLFNLIFYFIALILDNILGSTFGNLPYGIFYLLYGLGVFIPSLAVTVRRLHDVGKSGWMIFISLIPIVGTIWLLVLLATDSDSDENKYGANPKESHNADYIKNTETSQNDSITDTLILIIVIWMFASRFFWALIPKIYIDFYSTEWFILINGVFNFIWAFAPIGLAFAIKDKTKQMLLFILGGIYLLYGLFETVMLIIK